MGRGQGGSPAPGLSKKIGGREERQRAAMESGFENVEFRKCSLRITITKPFFFLEAVLCFVTQSYLTLCGPMDCSPPGSPVYGDSAGRNTGVDCHALLRRVFPAQRSNPGLLHCEQILYLLSHQGSLWPLEWVAHPFSRGSSQPRNQTRVSCLAGRFFTSWATRKAPFNWKYTWFVLLLFSPSK